MCHRILASTAVATLLAALMPASATRAADAAPITPQEIAALISKMKSSEVMGWAKIPWVPSLVQARRASKDENAPVFLFLHDGNIATGRC
jgi:hypothetical protein